ncbi:MAG TPA: PucR family transcriptional regulator ligand-binding domain-containing protein [Thermoleophilia bacterium]|nr:PucR family transcriptional regulator ligand-binding domain-containing protein [Thermoleophilia bacterium]
MVSVQDILAIPDLDLRLLAGVEATGDKVRWVHVAETPQAIQSLRGGELLLTTGHGFTGSEAQQVQRLRELVACNIAGLGFGTGFGFDEVPPALVRSAEECGLPLFEIPCHVSLSALSEAVAAKIVSDRYSLLQRSLAVYEKLTRIVLEEEGLDAILATLSGLTGCFAVLFDFHGVVLGEAASRNRFGAKTVGELWRVISERRAGRAAFEIDLGGTSLEARAYPVVAAHRTVGFIAAVKDSGTFSEYDRVVLHNVVTAAALEMVKRKAVAETEKRLVGDFVDGLTSSVLPEDEIARRLKVFGLDPQASHMVVIVEIDDHGGTEVQAVPQRLHWAVDEFMAERRLLCISTAREDQVVVLLQSGDLAEGDVRALAGDLLATVQDVLPDSAVLVGLGRSHPCLADLRRSYYEASYAIRICRLRGDSGMVAGYAELGSYSLLLGLQDTPSLDVFCDSVLGKLQKHDEQSSCDLLPSLAAFLEANGRWGDAADKLFIHRHSLRYRMKRVQEITGRDLSEPQDRMEFWLALKARQFIDGVGGVA